MYPVGFNANRVAGAQVIILCMRICVSSVSVSRWAAQGVRLLARRDALAIFTANGH